MPPAHPVLKWSSEGYNVGLLDNSSLDEAPTLVMARKPLPFSAATDDRTIVDDVALAAPKPARAPSLPPRPTTASKQPPPVASAPVAKMKTPAQPPRPTPSVPRPRSASTPPPLPAASAGAKPATPSRAPVPPLPAAAKRPLAPRAAAPVHAHG